MTDETRQADGIPMAVLVAHDGSAYLLPRELLDVARLNGEAAAAVRAAAEPDDVSGYTFSFTAPMAVPSAPAAPTAQSMTQMDMLQLQSMMNKYNQQMEMMSNIVSKFNATHQQIINNMR